MDSKTFLFRKFLYQVSNHLSKSEVSSLKFMLDDTLPRRQLEDAASGFDIFCLMEEKGLLSSDDLGFLEEILEAVGKKHFIERYLATKESTTAALKPVPYYNADTTQRQNQGGMISSQKYLLHELGDQMSAENIRDLALFAHGDTSSIHVKDLEKLNTAQDIFKRLERSSNLQSGDFTVLYNIFDVIGRQDLCEMIAIHCSTQDTKANVKSPIPVEGEPLTSYPHSLPSSGYPSRTSFSSSMESRDGPNHDESVVLIPSPEVSTFGAPSSQSWRIKELEQDQLELQRQLATAMKQVQIEQDQSARVRGLEEQLKQKIVEVEQLRMTANMLGQATPRPPSYVMDKSPHGVAVVIVNEKFDCNPCEPDLGLPKREGAQKDRELFHDTFIVLGYEVRLFMSITAEKMHTVIEEAMAGSENADSFVCCVSTHGNANGLYGSDSVLLKWSEIHALAMNAKHLRGKPKLFFFQSCRRSNNVTADGMGSSRSQEDEDILKVFACTPNKEAFISPEYGSWLATSIKRHFTNPGLMHTSSLNILLNYVSSEVNNQVGMLIEGNQPIEVQQCVHRESSLKKDVYFFREKN